MVDLPVPRPCLSMVRYETSQVNSVVFKLLFAIKQNKFGKNSRNLICVVLASTREDLSSLLANNKGADQPVHPHSRLSAFDICFLESIISKLVTDEIIIFWLVSVAEETGLSLALSETLKTSFSASRSKCFFPSFLYWSIYILMVDKSIHHVMILPFLNQCIFSNFCCKNYCCKTIEASFLKKYQMKTN